MNQIKKIIDEIDENKFTSQEVINFINNQNERESWVSLKDVKQIIQKQFNTHPEYASRGVVSSGKSQEECSQSLDKVDSPDISILDKFCDELKGEIPPRLQTPTIDSTTYSIHTIIDKLKKKHGEKQ